MKYEKPEIEDLGMIGDNTFLNPGNSHKGTSGLDPFGEISVKGGS